jgi:hypothetical protein
MAKLKKFKLKGGEHPCIVQQYEGPVKQTLEKFGNKLRPWVELMGGDPGFIIGSAIHFIPLFLIDRENDTTKESDGVERFICTGPWPHDYLIQHLRYDEALMVQTHDCDQTTYGFVTSNGYFVDRDKAGQIWKQMLTDSGWRDEAFAGEHPGRLYSYNLKPEVIEHAQNAAALAAAQPAE